MAASCSWLLIEGIARHDLSLATKERIVQVSFVFLLTLIVFVIYNDVVKLIPPTQPPDLILMKKISPEMQVFKEYLAAKKLKQTAHRKVILETFLAGEGPPQRRRHLPQGPR